MDQTEKKESYWSRGAGLRDIPSFNSLLQFHISTTITAKYSTSSKQKRTKIMKNPIAEYPSWTWQVSSVRNQGWRLFLSRQRAKVMVLRGDMQLRRKSIHFDVFTLIFFSSEARFATFFFVCALPKHTILNQSTPKTVFVCTITNWNKGKSWPIAIFFHEKFIKSCVSNSDCGI